MGNNRSLARRMAVCAAVLMGTALGTLPLAAASPKPAPLLVKLPGGKKGIGLDDFYFDRSLGKLVVPAGRTGKLDLIDPGTLEVSAIGGFSDINSADSGEGLIFTADRAEKKLYVVDGNQKKIVAAAPLAESPDCVRFSAPTREIWVTQPRKSQIEVLALPAAAGAPEHAAFIGSPHGGFEALVVDASRGRAYSNQGGVTLAIDLKSREIVSRWANGCKAAQGLSLDEPRGFLIVACREGRAAVLDAAHEGKRLSSLQGGEGLDIIAYSRESSHVYLPGGQSATMTFASLSAEGKLVPLGTVPTAERAHCAAADDRGGVWVCDPQNGRLLYFHDRFPAQGISAGAQSSQ